METDKNKDLESNIKPDKETLDTTDPQEEMKGPVSSLLQKGKKIIDKTGAIKGHITHDEAKDKDPESGL